MIVPSGRAAVLAVLCALPALAVAVALPGVWYLGLLPLALLGALLAVDAVLVAPGRAAPLPFDAPATAFVGQRLDFAIATPPGVEVRLEHDERLVADAGPPGYRAARRGLARLEALWVRRRAPLGLASHVARRPLDREIAILPDLRPARAAALRLFRRDMAQGETVQRDRGEGAEFDALAEFRAGMDRRAIDWKRSAHHNKLLAKEFRIERNNDVVFAIDAGRAMSDPVDGLPRIDRAVSAALAAAFVALKLGDKVQLFGFAARPQIASGALAGVGKFGLFQQLAADIDYSAEETNFTLALTALQSRLTRRSLVLVFTDVSDPSSAELMLRAIARLSARHLVLFVLMRDDELVALTDVAPENAGDVSRAVVAASLLRERRIVIERLRRLGARVVEAPHERLGPELVNAYLDVKRQGAL